MIFGRILYNTAWFIVKRLACLFAKFVVDIIVHLLRELVVLLLFHFCVQQILHETLVKVRSDIALGKDVAICIEHLEVHQQLVVSLTVGIDKDVRSQIHEMSTKKEANGSHGPGQQNESLGGMPTYGVVPSTSGDKVTQQKSRVNKNSDRNSDRASNK